MSPARKIVLFVGLRAAFCVAMVSAFALLTHSARTNVGFTTGNVDVQVEPADAALSPENMAPGDRRYGALTIQNAGTLAIRYTLAASTTNVDDESLADQLFVEARSVQGACDEKSFDAAGYIIAPPRQLETPARSNPRKIVPGKGETACFKVSLTLDAGNQYQTPRRM